MINLLFAKSWAVDKQVLTHTRVCVRLCGKSFRPASSYFKYWYLKVCGLLSIPFLIIENPLPPSHYPLNGTLFPREMAFFIENGFLLSNDFSTGNGFFREKAPFTKLH